MDIRYTILISCVVVLFAWSPDDIPLTFFQSFFHIDRPYPLYPLPSKQAPHSFFVLRIDAPDYSTQKSGRWPIFLQLLQLHLLGFPITSPSPSLSPQVGEAAEWACLECVVGRLRTRVHGRAMFQLVTSRRRNCSKMAEKSEDLEIFGDAFIIIFHDVLLCCKF